MTAWTTPRKPQNEDTLKTYCKHLEITPDLIQVAYENWSKAQAGKKNAHRVIKEHGSPEALIQEIHQEIQDRSLKLRPVHRYKRTEPTNGKTRLIGVQSVKQQVCDYVAVTALEPFLTAKTGFYQVSSIKGKGQLFAARTIRRWAQEGGHFVHLDVRQCYPTISGDLVRGILKKYVASSDVLYLADVLLATYKTGLDIGSYFSLRMAQLVLSFAYHYVSDLGKTRRGKHVPLVAHALFYMDDLLLMGTDKRDLRSATRRLETFMRRKLGLELKPWKICQVGDDEPIDMAGYVIRPGRTTIRSSIFLRARKAHRVFQKNPTLRNARRVCAYWGWLKYADTKTFQDTNEILHTQRLARQLISQERPDA